MKRLVLSVVLAGLMLLIMALPVYALEPPDSMSIQSVRAFRNLAEIGDMLIVFHYRYVDASGYPTTPASSSILFKLYSEGGDLLAASEPYVFYAFGTNGYGDGVSSFYFGADNVTTDWGDALQIVMCGLPAYYDPLIPPASRIMTSADYSGSEEIIDSQNDLYNKIMSLCITLTGIYPTVPLRAVTDGVTVLSNYGETYFRGAIPGIQLLSPGLFLTQVYVPTVMPVEPYNMSLQDRYTARLIGTDLMRGADRLGDVVGGISGTFVWGFIVFAGCLALCIFTMRKGWGIESGMVGGAGFVILFALLMGDLFFTLTMIGALLAAMAIMFVFGYKRA